MEVEYIKGAPGLDGCRSCGSSDLEPILDLGVSPLADRLPTDPADDEYRCPLHAVFCKSCSLVQIVETVDPEILFYAEYPYFSSVSASLLEHTKQNVEEIIATRNLGPDHLVVELASNDGYLLQYYHRKGIRVLGIDPSEAPAKKAREAGIETLITFFSHDAAKQLRADGISADVIHGNNVLAHVADTNGFVAGIGEILGEDGIVVIEAPYVRDLIEKNEFDTIYHQHLCYFSVTAVDALFRRHGMYLNDVRRIPIHGGSLRLFFGKKENVQPSVRTVLAEERQIGIDRPEFYRDFAERVRGFKKALLDLLQDLRSQGKRIAGYGAAAKGCTLINYVGIDRNLMEFIVDRNEYKQGKYMSGQLQPIRAPEYLLESMPDYVLILPWNFADEILRQQAEFRSRGGKFIVPLPELKIV